MKAHLTRGIAALLNLTLAGLYWWAWIALALDRHGFKGCTKDFASCIALAVLVTATIAATGATVLLARKSTARAGLSWHSIVGWGWIGFIVACTLGQHSENYIRNLLLISAVIAPIGALWPITGYWVRRSLDEENTTPISPVVSTTQTVAASAVSTAQMPLAIPQHSVSEAIPLIARRRAG